MPSFRSRGEEGWGWLSVGDREFWRVKSGVGGDPTRTVWETEGRFGAVGRERRWDTHPDGSAAMQVPRRELPPILELCVGREWARSAHVRGEVVGRGILARRVKFNSRVDGNRVGGFRPLLTFALRVLHPRVGVRSGVHPELEHLLPSGFHDHVAVRVPA